jgi:2-dehydro-3-deoxyglucarate aldolase
MNNSDFKQAVRSGAAPLGSWLLTPHPAVAEVMARAGFQWLTLDLEHGQFDLENATQLLRAIAAYDCLAFVRLPVNDRTYIARYLDAGAQGIIVPMLRQAEDVVAMVAAAKYPPDGQRGFGFCRANAYGVDFAAYAAQWNSDVIIIGQIEHVDAVGNIETIAKVPGLDGLIIGPYDLAGSMGHVGQIDHPDVIAAITRVKVACAKQDVPLGFHLVHPTPERIDQVLREAYRFYAFGLDLVLLNNAVRPILDQAHEFNESLTP